MTDQTDTSASVTSGGSCLALIFALVPLYARLLDLGITQLRIAYNGKQGIGDVRTRASNARGDIVTSNLDDEITNHISVLVRTLLDQRYPKWLLGDGAFGHIDWDLRCNELIHKHHRRTITVTTTEHRGM